MPLAKIHVLEGRYDERRLSNVSKAVQDALMSILKIPPDDFFQIIHVLPRNRFLHTPSFLGLKYSDELVLLELTFISGRPKETRLALLREWRCAPFRRSMNEWSRQQEFHRMICRLRFMRYPAKTCHSVRVLP